MTKIDEVALAFLEELKTLGSYRQLQNTGTLVDFQSNDYLGLGHDPGFSGSLISFLAEKSHGGTEALAAATGSRLISGSYEEVSRFEHYLAEYYGGGAALFFPNGYLANLALITAVSHLGVSFAYDEYVHASQRDALKLTRAQAYQFHHQNLEHLQRRLRGAGENNLAVVLVESLYSMEGDYFDLVQYRKVFSGNESHLILDAAHTGGLTGLKIGDGVISRQGYISYDEQLLPRISAMPNPENESAAGDILPENMTLLITFGKTFGVGGAAVICSTAIKELMINKARPFIYSTAPPPYQVLAAFFAHNYVKNKGIKFVTKLQDLCQYFRGQAQKHLGIDLPPGPIFPVLIPGNFQVMRAAEELRNQGLGVTAIRSPTVPKNSERLRIVLHAHNTDKEIDRLIATLKSFGV